MKSQNSESIQKPIGSAVKTTLRTFLQSIPAIFLFEVVYRLCCAIMIRPLLSWFTQAMVSLSGTKLLFNGDMLRFFLTPFGWIAGLVYLAVSAYMIYFEFSVIILIAHSGYQGKRMKLRTAMKTSLTTFRSLKGFGFFGFCFYAMILLPFVNSGLSSSLIPSLDLPKFVTGELLKSGFGVTILLVAALLAIVLIYLFLFVLPAMILGKMRFGEARKYSSSIQKGKRFRLWLLYTLTILIIVSLLFALFFLSMHLLGVTGDIGSAEYLNHISSILMSPQGWAGLLVLLLASLLQMIMAQFILAILVSLYCSLGGIVQVQPEDAQKVDAFFSRADTRFTDWLYRHFPSMRKENGQKPFLLRHWKKIALSLAVIILLAGNIGATTSAMPALSQRLIIGHRGSMHGVENTLGAIQGAIDAGADYAEIDVLLSKDNVPMVIHDTNLKRLSGQDIQVYDKDAAELQQIMLRQNGHEDHLPTLEETIEFCKGKIGLLIEFKLHGHETESLVKKTFEVVQKTDFEKQAIYHTMDTGCLEEAQKLEPNYRIGYIIFGSLGSIDAKTLGALGIDFIVIEEGLATEHFFNESNKAALPAFVWTVNEQESMEEYYTAGASAIISDYPDLAKKALEKTAEFHHALQSNVEKLSTE